MLKGIAQKRDEKGTLSWEKKEKTQTFSLPTFDYKQVVTQITKQIEEDKKLYPKLLAVGHRVVHGGEHFSSAILLDDLALQKIENCSSLAPLHNPINLLGIQTAKEIFPHLPHVAIFDTAFHQTMPDYAYLYPLPYSFYRNYQVRRYGFHGMSHAFVVSEAAKTVEKPIEKTAFISAHLGAGCSVAAVLGGKSVDTSMGFTPLEGLVMGKRSGDIDPSIVPFLAHKLPAKVSDVLDILNQKSGLLGISETSEDMRFIENNAKAGDKQCALAMQIFCYRLAKYIASYLVPLERLDALIFTGGIGENSAAIREKTIDYLKPLGICLDKKRNADHGRKSHYLISKKESLPLAMVIPTDEELFMAREVAQLLEKKGSKEKS